MSKRLRRSPETIRLIEAILKAGKSATPALTASGIAKRIGVTPNLISRMKKTGAGDIAVVADMAATVGLQLTLTGQDALLEQVKTGTLFDD